MKKQITILALLLSTLLSSIGCEKKENNEEKQQNLEKKADAEKQVQEKAEAEQAEAAQLNESAYIVTTAIVRKSPSNDKYLPQEDPKAKKKSNWVSTLYRGEEITVHKIEGDWAQITTSGESKGFTHTSNFLLAKDVQKKTNLEEIKRFKRPDVLTMVQGKVIEAGTLFFVLKEKGEFSEVNYSGSYKTWIRSEKLNSEQINLDSAKLITLIRRYEKKNDEKKIKELKELGRESFAKSALSHYFGEISIEEVQEETKNDEKKINLNDVLKEDIKKEVKIISDAQKELQKKIGSAGSQ